MTLEQWKQAVFIGWFVVSLGDGVASAIACLLVRKLHEPFARRLMWVLVGVSVEAFIAGFSVGIWIETHTAIPMGFVVLRLLGRTFKAAVVGRFCTYLLRITNGHT